MISSSWFRSFEDYQVLMPNGTLNSKELMEELHRLKANVAPYKMGNSVLVRAFYFNRWLKEVHDINWQQVV